MSDTVLIRAPRVIDTLIPQVSIEEQLHDAVEITEHPVETGAAVTDHAFVRPSAVSMRVGWSNAYGGYETFVQDIYQQLVALKDRRQPFQLSTGKRVYDNMLIEELTVTTDANREFVLDCHVLFKELMLVSTQTTTLPSQQDMKSPNETAPVQQTGGKSLAAVSGTAGNQTVHTLTGAFASTPLA